MTEQRADLIVTDPDVVHGQARIRGTRIPVSVVLDCLAAGLSEDEILRHVPHVDGRGHPGRRGVRCRAGPRRNPSAPRVKLRCSPSTVTFGDLCHYPPGSHAGISVLRPASQDPATVLQLVEWLMQPQPLDQLAGCVAIVEPERIRIRRPDEAGPA